MPERILIVVDLPAPFGPTNATRSPGATVKLSPSTAVTVREAGAKSPRTAARMPGARSRTRNDLCSCST